MHNSHSRFLLGAALLAGVAPSLSAQSIWVSQHTGKAVALEMLKPSFDGDDETSLTTVVVFGSLRMPVGSTLVVVGELPFAHYGEQDLDDSDNTIGNPYVGVEIRSPGSPVFGEIGIRAPLASEDNTAAFVGWLADIHRWEAFVPNFLPISGAINYRFRGATGFVTRLRAGPNLWIATEEWGDDDLELLATYSAQVGYEASQFSMLGGLTGKAILSEEDINFGERTFHEVGAVVTLALGRVHPGVHVRLPLDEDMVDTLDYVFGVNLSIELP